MDDIVHLWHTSSNKSIKISIDCKSKRRKLDVEKMANAIKFIEKTYGPIELGRYHGHTVLAIGNYIIAASKHDRHSIYDAIDEYAIGSDRDLSSSRLLQVFDSINQAGFKIWLSYERNSEFYEKAFRNLEELAIQADLES